MKGIARIAAALIMGIALMFSLSACGSQTSSSTQTSSNAQTSSGAQAPSTLTLSEALDNGGVWFTFSGSASSSIKKNGTPSSVLVFEDGMVTCYDYVNLEYGDLNGLSDDEILEKVKESDKAGFEARKQTTIEYFNSKGYDTTQVSSLTYKEPEPVPYTLTVETDKTGNNTEKEKIKFSIETVTFYGSTNSQYNCYITKDYSIVLETDSGVYTVYDKDFAGYDGFMTIVDNGKVSYTLDSPTSENVDEVE